MEPSERQATYVTSRACDAGAHAHCKQIFVAEGQAEQIRQPSHRAAEQPMAVETRMHRCDGDVGAG